MTKFLIDAHLPYRFRVWNSPDYIHQLDLGPGWDDEQIWDYAKANGLTIVSKDKDFSNMVMMHTPPPRVIHIRFGNLKMKDFHQVISENWEAVCQLSAECKLVNVFLDRIEGID